MKKSFTCAGCQDRIKLDPSKPSGKRYRWRNASNTRRWNDYCSECDDKLIQGVDLPKPKNGKQP